MTEYDARNPLTPLREEQKAQMAAIKSTGQELMDLLAQIAAAAVRQGGTPRVIRLALTNVEQGLDVGSQACEAITL